MRMLVALVLGATSCEVLGYNETMNYLFIGEVYVFMDEDIAVRGARRARRAPRGA